MPGVHFVVIHNACEFCDKSYLCEIFKIVKIWVVIPWFVTSCSLVGYNQRLREPNGDTTQKTKFHENFVCILCVDRGVMI
jgi:hypothetical protein